MTQLFTDKRKRNGCIERGYLIFTALDMEHLGLCVPEAKRRQPIWFMASCLKRLTQAALHEKITEAAKTS
ncbi:MAG TPA: hypothetical protein DCW46_00210 [Desulfotomaculum sp.]|nr:hypothetical protein [Desulfotomaculum sp.]